MTLTCPTCTCTNTQAGTGVTFILVPGGVSSGGASDGTSGKTGGVNIAGNANVTLCPPNTATTGSGATIPKGLLFYQCDTSSANATCQGVTSFGTGAHISTGNNTRVTLTGIAYFPSGIVNFAQPAGSFTLTCFITVAKIITVASFTNNTTATNCSNAGITTDFPGTGVLAQKTYQVVMTQ